MSRYNRFGKAYTDVIACYPGTVAADYDAGGASGQTRVEDAMDRAAMEVAAALQPEVFTALTQVEAQEVISYASAGLASWTLGIVPVVAGSVHLWIYPLLPPPGSGSASFSLAIDDSYYQAPVLGYNEVATSDYSVTASSGEITYTGPRIALGNRIYASYTVDVDNASFSSPMLGQILVLGAAAELGERLYTAATQEWALVTQYRTRYNDMLDKLRDGTLIPDEIRRLKYFNEVERVNNEVRSVRFPRG